MQSTLGRGSAPTARRVAGKCPQPRTAIDKNGFDRRSISVAGASARLKAILLAYALGSIVGAGIPSVAYGQRVLGVVEAAAGIPVSGVVLLLVGSADTAVARALSDERGRFSFGLLQPGEYRVQARRIGFGPVTSEAFILTPGTDKSLQLAMTGIAVRLAEVRIRTEATCGRRGAESTSMALALWEQMRTALAAEEITAAARGMTVSAVEFSRTLDAAGQKTLRSNSVLRREQVRRAWQERTAATLRRDGYVTVDSVGAFVYHLPGSAVLGSSAFLEDHCIHLSPLSDSRWLVLGFEPRPGGGRTPDIRGEAWLDRATAELQRIAFEYTNLPAVRQDGAAGALEFARLKDGSWIISSWRVRMPIVEQVSRTSQLGGSYLRLAEMAENGAALIVAQRGTDTLWTATPLLFSGRVLDSTSSNPIVGAAITLGPSRSSATTDARGRFTIRSLVGEHDLEVRTPSLDSVQAVYRSKLLLLDSPATIADVRVPSAGDVRLLMAERNRAGFAGQVLADSSERPILDAEVLFPGLSISVRTDTSGRFRLSEIPAGVHRVVVRKLGFAPFEAPVYFTGGRIAQRRVLLSRLTTLDTARITADAAVSRLPRSFEDNRNVGLGHFITRADLEMYDGASLQLVLSRIPSLALVSGRQGQAWIQSNRSRSLLNRCPPPRPLTAPPVVGGSSYCVDRSEASRGMKSGCYARVYFDGVLMNPGYPSEPFDVNAIAPSQVEALEFYSGPAQTPAKYSGLNSACGVFVIHGRRPGS